MSNHEILAKIVSRRASVAIAASQDPPGPIRTFLTPPNSDKSHFKAMQERSHGRRLGEDYPMLFVRTQELSTERTWNESLDNERKRVCGQSEEKP